MAGGKASVRKISLAERQQAALSLRKQGGSYRQIAEQMRGALDEDGNQIAPAGYSHVSAYNDVMAALAELREDTKAVAREYLLLQLTQLDEMVQAWWTRMEHTDIGAADVLLRIQDRQARLLGLYEKEQPTTNVNLNVADIDRAIERELARLAAGGETGDAGTAEGEGPAADGEDAVS